MEQFSEEQINQIKRLNDLLKREEERVLLFSKKLLASLDEMIEQKQIDDYNFDCRLSLFSDNADCNKRNNVEEGNPIYEDYLTIFGKNKDDCFFTDDWNELYAEHPLRHIPFCYSMHCIYSHSHLTWEDILQIDDVWIDLKVDYQFMINTKSNKSEISELELIQKVTEIIHVPKLSETVQEIIIRKWHKEIGDNIEKGDVLAELETKDAIFDLESYSKGVLLYKGIEDGGTMKVDDVMAVIGIYKTN